MSGDGEVSLRPLAQLLVAGLRIVAVLCAVYAVACLVDYRAGGHASDQLYKRVFGSFAGALGLLLALVLLLARWLSRPPRAWLPWTLWLDVAIALVAGADGARLLWR